MNKVLIIDDDKELCALIKRSVLSEDCLLYTSKGVVLENGRKSDWQGASGTPAHPPAACSLRHSRPRCRTGG